jgi:peptidoglycan/LPS O-acetylase OafA/YrhL
LDIAVKISLILHLIGIGALLSGFFYQLKDWGKGMKVNAGILHGAWLQLITGFALAGLVPAMGEETINPFALAIKAVVITVIFFVAYSFNKKEVTPKWVVPAIAGLTTINIIVAVVGPIVQAK